MRDLKDIKKDIFDLTSNYSDIYFGKKKFVPGKTFIPVSGKVLDKDELTYMVEASLDAWLTAGKFNKSFERELAEFLDIKSLMTVNSGSSANLVAFSALTSEKLGERAIKSGDEVITVAAGFPTTVNPILMHKAIPVFVDVKLGNYNIDEEKIEKAVTKKTKAIMLAHTLGNPFNLDVVKSICEKYGLWLIEDACDALGTTFNKKKVGTFGDFGTLSFYPAHHITMGEGGAVFTNNLKLKKIAESFRDWGRDCFCEPGVDNTCQRRFCWKLGELPKGYDHKYIYSHSGFNLKITEMQAACGLGQIKKINRFTKARKSNFNFYLKKFKKLEEFFILPKKTTFSDPSWFGFPITIRDNNTEIRNNLMKCLEEKRIGARLLFAGNITKQPYFKNQEYRIIDTLENTDKIMHDTLWLGVYPGLNHEMLSYVYETISLFVKKLKK